MLQDIQIFLANLLRSLTSLTDIFWSNFDLAKFSTWQIILDILLVALIFYWILYFLKGSRAVPVIISILFLALLSFLAQALDLIALSWLFEYLATLFVIAIPIIFQTELRRGLEKLGHPYRSHSRNLHHQKTLIESILKSTQTFSKEKTGATLVIKRSTPLKEYIETGLQLNANLSPELILSIFNKKSPLHDGATILQDSKILSVSSVLPLSLSPSPPKWGMRHKSALGLSEQTDALIIVISEENGQLTLFQNGHATENITPNKLRLLLEQELLSRRQLKHLSKKFKTSS